MQARFTRKKQVHKKKNPPPKPEPYGSKSRHAPHSHEAHNAPHHEHSHSEQRNVSSKALDAVYTFAYKAHETAEVLTKHEHHSKSILAIATHLTYCYRILEEIQPTHNTEFFEVDLGKLHAAEKQLDDALKQLKHYIPHDSHIKHLIGEANRAKAGIDELIHVG